MRRWLPSPLLSLAVQVVVLGQITMVAHLAIHFKVTLVVLLQVLEPAGVAVEQVLQVAMR